MTIDPIVSSVMEIIQLLASPEEQEEYQADSQSDIGPELLAWWCEDIYSEDARERLLGALTVREGQALEEFNVYIQDRLEAIPDSFEEMQDCEEWVEIVEKAGEVLEKLGWGQ